MRAVDKGGRDVSIRKGGRDVSIHITGTNTTEERPRPNGLASRKASKKPKTTVDSSDAPSSNPSQRRVEVEKASRAAPDISFRYLFSFDDGSPRQHRDGSGNASKAPGSFSFLGGAGDTPENRAKSDALRLRDGTPDEDLESRQVPPDQQPFHPLLNFGKELGKTDDPASHAFQPQDFGKPPRQPTSGDVISPSPSARGGLAGAVQRPRANDYYIRDDIASRPAAILEIAKRFCRQKSIEDLEDEWCAANGVRDSMRRDFKQKRQNAARGRKLGTSTRES